MNIIVTNLSTNFTSPFQIIKFERDDESMKNFAKTAILFANQEYPDDDFKKCYLIAKKFDERYNGNWSCSFIKEGAVAFRAFGNHISIKFNDYYIKIAKTSPFE